MLPVMATETELLILLFQEVQHHMILAGLGQQTDYKIMPLMFQEEAIKLQGSAGGDYDVTITDDNGCIKF